MFYCSFGEQLRRFGVCEVVHEIHIILRVAQAVNTNGHDCIQCKQRANLVNSLPRKPTNEAPSAPDEKVAKLLKHAAQSVSKGSVCGFGRRRTSYQYICSW